MLRKFFLVALTSLALSACVENPRATGITEPDDTEGDTSGQASAEATVIPSTGGRAVSADGKFSVLIGPRVFDATIEMTITQEEAPDEGLTSMSPRYTVTYTPEEVTPFSDASFRVQFEVKPEVIAETGIENIALQHLEPGEGQEAVLKNVNLSELQSSVWISVDSLGGFGLVDTRGSDACLCNADESCDELCACDPDCEPIDETDPSDPTDPTDASDPSVADDPTDPLTCDETEYMCADQAQCIPASNFCDGLPQCNDGSDETDPACSGGGTGGGGTGAVADEWEPDNSFSEASTYVIGEPQVHSISSGDDDYVLLTLDGTYEVIIELSGPTGDSTLTLYSENYTQLAYNDDYNGLFSRIHQTPLYAGNYFIKASGFAGTSTIPSYTLTITVTEPLADPPQNLAATVGDDGSVELTWNPIADTSGYRVYYGTYPGDWNPSYPASEGAPPLNTLETSQTLTGLAPGTTYYFAVSSLDADGAESYLSPEVSAEIPVSQDAFEPDDTFGQAMPIANGDLQERSIHIPADVDYATFNMPVSGNVRIETDGPVGDSVLYLYDSSFNQVAYNDQGGTGNYSFSLIQEDVSAGTYYIKVESWLNSGIIGFYTLDLDITYNAPEVDGPDAFEIDDTVEQAQAIELGVTQDRSFHREGDLDWIAFTLEALSDITVTTAGALGGSIVSVYDSANELLGTAGSEQAGSFAALTLEGLEAGTYYVETSSDNTWPILFYEVSVDATVYPAAPTNLVATPGAGQIVLTWDASPGATHYNVHYVYSGNQPFETINANEGPSPLNTETLSFGLSGLPMEAATYLRVTAVNNEQESEFSETINASPLAPCDEGTEESQVCGLNANGSEVRTCTDGHWSAYEACVDPDVCTNDASDSQVCGLNNNGTQSRTCSAGQWGEFSECVDPDVCTNEASESQACGLNGSGTETRTCADGQWGEFQACVDTDVCTNDEAETLSCGFNDQGSQTRTCAEGQWGEPTECVDPDVCVNGAEETQACGTDDAGSQARTCSEGQWSEFGDCSES